MELRFKPQQSDPSLHFPLSSRVKMKVAKINKAERGLESDGGREDLYTRSSVREDLEEGTERDTQRHRGRASLTSAMAQEGMSVVC